MLLRREDGRYFDLNETGARIWDLLDVHRTPEALARLLAAEYEVSTADALAEVEAFLDALVAEGIVRPVDDGSD